jgi:hypothetical protein
MAHRDSHRSRISTRLYPWILIEQEGGLWNRILGAPVETSVLLFLLVSIARKGIGNPAWPGQSLGWMSCAVPKGERERESLDARQIYLTVTFWKPCTGSLALVAAVISRSRLFLYCLARYSKFQAKVSHPLYTGTEKESETCIPVHRSAGSSIPWMGSSI